MGKSGFLLIDKPLGPTSFDVIRTLRKKLGIRKMGHAGTLDPLASGLLIIAVGEATKLLPYMNTDRKTYLFELSFGTETDTDDREGSPRSTSPFCPSKEELENCLAQFRGTIEQKPPRYSAIKIQGKRAYKKARHGETFDIPARTVQIYELTLCAFDQQNRIAQFRADVSAGTYIRSLCRDIARAVGSVGHASKIHRDKIGAYSLSHAVAPDDCSNNNFCSPVDFPDNWTPYEINEADQKRVLHGMFLQNTLAPLSQLLLLHRKNTPIALAQAEGERINPKKVFPSWE
ncbi:tRNA pseudouridine(55) synthase TruB [Chitinivibrio alkaliphilus]|uniref:tRNA pseudouridine synthase B n=1 Tax=Chitinivibrio alkaliphilus ACht1 TaxID=1313304 RepID=U7D6K1_9BACT|nr:tRNA pseudouridine(55) synthase TruB [Chitinivibrio alkaliphilus]ERP32144.1 tRNA pseudouridine synthase B [Chitinivibrio alkaliphilus ACht1]